MTWSARDGIPRQKRGKFTPAPRPPVESGPRSADPDKVPVYAQRAEDQLVRGMDAPFRFTSAEERDLMAEGIWPEREWSIWRHAMTRGIQAE